MTGAGHLLWILFGPGTWGSGGNMVAWVICGILAGLWIRAKMKAHSVAQLAQSALHHKQAMAQAQEHHAALLAHVTATAAAAEPGETTVTVNVPAPDEVVRQAPRRQRSPRGT